MYVQLLIIILGFLALRWYPQVGSEAYQAKQHKKYIIFMMVLLILQSGLRHVAVGADTYNYYVGYYLNVENTSWQSLWHDCMDFLNYGEGKDPGYRLLLKAIQYVLPTFQLYLLGLATFVFWGLGKLLGKLTKSNYEVLLAVALYQCLYYSFISITGLRQTMATGFLFFAVPYAMRRRPWHFVFFILLAATQHKSALLFAPFYMLPLIKKSRVLLICAFAAFMPMWTMSDLFSSILTLGGLFEQYSAYLNYKEAAGAYGFAAFILVLGFLLIYHYKAITQNHNDVHLVINSVAVAILLTPLTVISPANMRIVQYYSIYALFALPLAVSKISFTKRLNDRYIIVILLLTLYTISKNFKYAFFWQEMALGANYY